MEKLFGAMEITIVLWENYGTKVNYSLLQHFCQGNPKTLSQESVCDGIVRKQNTTWMQSVLKFISEQNNQYVFQANELCLSMT